MNFGKTLNLLLQMTDKPISDLATYINYDRSHVSRWVNGKSLPLNKTWESLLPRMASYFSTSLGPLDVETLLSYFPLARGLKNPGGPSTELLTYLLDTVYIGQIQQDDLDQAGLRGILPLNGRRRVSNFLVNLLTQAIYSVGDPGVIYCRGDIINLFTDEMIDHFHMSLKIPNDVRIKFSGRGLYSAWGDKEVIFPMINRYLRLLSNLSYLEFEIYCPDKALEDLVEITSKDQFFAWGFDIEGGTPTTLFLTEDLDLIQDYHESIAQAFKDENGVLVLREGFPAIPEIYPDSPQTHQPILYIPYIHLFFGSRDLKDHLASQGRINPREEALWSLAQSYLESGLAKHFRIMVPRSAVQAFFDKGWVKSVGSQLQLFGQDYQDFVGHIRETFNYSSIHIIEDLDIENGHRLPFCTIYGDKSRAYIIKEDESMDMDLGHSVYEARHSNVVDMVYMYLQALDKIEEDNFLAYKTSKEEDYEL